MTDYCLGGELQARGRPYLQEYCTLATSTNLRALQNQLERSISPREGINAPSASRSDRHTEQSTVVAYPVLVAEKNDTDAVGPTVIRSTSGYWLTGALTIVVIIFSIDATVRGDLGYFLAIMPWELLAIWLLFVTLVRPRILVYPGRLRVINLLRSHDIAWSAIGHLGGRYQLIISLQDGRKISCWGAPATGPTAPRTST